MLGVITIAPLWHFKGGPKPSSVAPVCPPHPSYTQFRASAKDFLLLICDDPPTPKNYARSSRVEIVGPTRNFGRGRGLPVILPLASLIAFRMVCQLFLGNTGNTQKTLETPRNFTQKHAISPSELGASSPSHRIHKKRKRERARHRMPFCRRLRRCLVQIDRF